MDTCRFPVERLIPRAGSLSFNEFGASIELALEPFELEFHGEIVTTILIDCIHLPSNDIASLSMQVLQFPRNPDADAPEGSMYIERHHPVDLLAMQFGPVGNGEVEVRLALGFAFSFEGLAASETCEYADTAGEFTARIEIRKPQTLQ